MESLSARWTDWWSRSSTASTGSYSLTLWFFEHVVYYELQQEGICVPARRHCEYLLCKDLEPLVQRMCPVGHRNQKLVTLLHVLNFIWQPILDYVEELAEHDLPWPDPLTKNLELLHLEMAGVLPEPQAHLVMDEWIGFVQESIHRLVDVTVPLEVLSRVLSPIVPLTLAPTRANAMRILRSPSWSSKLVGRTLGLQLSRGIMSEIGEVPVPRPGKDDVLEGLKSEVLDHLWQEHGPRDDDDAECQQVRKKARRDAGSLSSMLKAKTQQCLWILSNRIPIRRAGEILHEARDLLQNLEHDNTGPQGPQGPQGPHGDLDEVLVCRQQLSKHL